MPVSPAVPDALTSEPLKSSPLIHSKSGDIVGSKVNILSSNEANDAPNQREVCLEQPSRLADEVKVSIQHADDGVHNNSTISEGKIHAPLLITRTPFLNLCMMCWLLICKKLKPYRFFIWTNSKF